MGMTGISIDKAKFLETLSRSLSKSFGSKSLNKSLTQPGFLEAYCNFQYSNVSPYKDLGSPTTNLALLEDKFCKDFNCCGIQLGDMHELLQHFEDCHVVVEGDEMDEDDDLQFQFEGNNYMAVDENMELNSANDSLIDNTFSDMYFNKKKRSTSHSVALSDIYQNDAVSAFETSIIRKRSASQNDSFNNSNSNQPWLRPFSDSPPQTFPVIMDQDPKPSPSSPASTIEQVETPVKRKGSRQKDIGCYDKEKDDRPYKCKITGCNKAYKNPGGLKYHLHHGHCEDTGDPEMNNIIHKPYQCSVSDCGKRYKNLNGLKYHIEHAHNLWPSKVINY